MMGPGREPVKSKSYGVRLTQISLSSKLIGRKRRAVVCVWLLTWDKENSAVSITE